MNDSGSNQFADTEQSDSVVYFLQVDFKVPRERHRAYVFLMKRFQSIVYDLYEWELVHASYPLSGEINQFCHVWRIPRLRDLLRMMKHGAFDEKADPTHFDKEVDAARRRYFRGVYWELQSVIVETTHHLTTALPADPFHAGYQSQTILIDRKGDRYLFTHQDMREKWQDADISEELEKYRFANPKFRAEEDKPKAPKYSKNNKKAESERAYFELECRIHELETETRGALKKEGATRGACKEAQLEKIRDLLNNGATSARVESHLHSGQSTLLVNLAALKARSVLQEPYVPPQGVDEIPVLDVSGGSQQTALLIATPWGSVYDVTGDELAALGRHIPSKKGDAVLERTHKRLDRFKEFDVPLGSVLEPRDDQVGDGCACYVINLQAFPGAKG